MYRQIYKKISKQMEINILKKKVNTSNVKRSKASSATKNCHQNKRKKAKEKRETETKPMHLTMILSQTRKTLPIRKIRSQQKRKRQIAFQNHNLRKLEKMPRKRQ